MDITIAHHTDRPHAKISHTAASMSPQRLLKEYREAKSAKLDPEITLNLTDETDIFLWTAHLKGPEGTPYDGGTFVISLRCPASYPLAPPKCAFVTPVFHPCASPFDRPLFFLLGSPPPCALLELAGQKCALQDGRYLP